MDAATYRKRFNEKDFQRQITKLAGMYRWTFYHNPYSLGSDTGYPDLTLVHQDFDKLWIEVKGPKGRIHPDQVKWLAWINAGPTGLAIVAFPDDLEAVGELLQGNPVDIYEHEGVLRVRLPGSEDQ